MRSYRRVFRDQWLLIVAAVLVALLVAGAVTLLAPRTYLASTQLFVTAQVESNPSVGSQFAQDEVRSYAEIVDSPTITAPVIEELQLDDTPAELGDRITADVPLDTAVLNISVEDSSAKQAAQIADAVAERLKATATELETPDGQTSASVKITVVKEAAVPTAAVSPQPMNNLLLALLLGLGLGVGLALLRDSDPRTGPRPRTTEVGVGSQPLPINGRIADGESS